MESELIPDAVLLSMFPKAEEGGECFMFATQGKKISRFGIAQDRIIMLSTQGIYLLTEKEARRAI